jgi:hypothetical protein
MEGAGQRSMKAAAYRRSGICERLQSIYDEFTKA